MIAASTTPAISGMAAGRSIGQIRQSRSKAAARWITALSLGVAGSTAGNRPDVLIGAIASQGQPPAQPYRPEVSCPCNPEGADARNGS